MRRWLFYLKIHLSILSERFQGDFFKYSDWVMQYQHALHFLLRQNRYRTNHSTLTYSIKVGPPLLMLSFYTSLG